MTIVAGWLVWRVTVNRKGLNVRNPPTSMLYDPLPTPPPNTTRQLAIPFTSVTPVPEAQASVGPVGSSGIRRVETFGTG
jgi:hypothetical protein